MSEIVIEGALGLGVIVHSSDGIYWTATLPDYDGPPDPCGSGRSEDEAVADLLEQIGQEDEP